MENEELDDLIVEVKENEIGDKKLNPVNKKIGLQLLSTIGTLTPQTIALIKSGDLYQLKSGVLHNLKDGSGKITTMWKGDGKIIGHAKLENVSGLANAQAIASVMQISSMVTGMYYMSQIDSSIKTIGKTIGKIYDVQISEVEGKITTVYNAIKNIGEIVREGECSQEELDLYKKKILDYQDQLTTFIHQANSFIDKVQKRGTRDLSDLATTLPDLSMWKKIQKLSLEMLRLNSQTRYDLENNIEVDEAKFFKVYNETVECVEKENEDTKIYIDEQIAKYKINQRTKREIAKIDFFSKMNEKLKNDIVGGIADVLDKSVEAVVNVGNEKLDYIGQQELAWNDKKIEKEMLPLIEELKISSDIEKLRKDVTPEVYIKGEEVFLAA
ncbi:MAG: hypothetical protein LBN08_01085 [Lactobacillales bacterium]|jgi:hypothetical protein|nr:hypothetical protein [Lactobacillales bacterium]